MPKTFMSLVSYVMEHNRLKDCKSIVNDKFRKRNILKNIFKFPKRTTKTLYREFIKCYSLFPMHDS